MLTGCKEENPIVSSEPDPVAAEQFINTHSFTDYATTKGLTPANFEFTGYASKLIAAGAVPVHDCYVVASKPTTEKKGSAAEIVGIPLVQDGEFSHLALFAVTDSGAEHKAGADLDGGDYGYVRVFLDHTFRDMNLPSVTLTDLTLDVKIEDRDKSCEVVIITTTYYITLSSLNMTFPPRFDGMTSEALITCNTDDPLSNNGRVFLNGSNGAGSGVTPTASKYSFNHDPANPPAESPFLPADAYLECSVWNFSKSPGGRDITVLDGAFIRFNTVDPISGVIIVREIPVHIAIDMDAGDVDLQSIGFRRCLSNVITQAQGEVGERSGAASFYSSAPEEMIIINYEQILNQNIGQCLNSSRADINVEVVAGFWRRPNDSYRSVAKYTSWFGQFINCLW